jgi:SAM-dependent methyltransferase
MNYAEEYASEGYKSVGGFDVNGQNLLAIHLLSSCQAKNGITGDLLEIGLFHGRTTIMLGMLRNRGERVIGIDAFGSSAGIDHEDRQVDLDYYGDGHAIKQAFESNWEKFILKGSPEPALKPTIIERDSREISPEQLREVSSNVRLFSLDGGHSEISTFHDLELAEAVVKDGGVLVLDDYFLEDCPAVSVGAMRYFLTRDSKFVPFLIFCGRVFFTTRGYEKTYREAIFSGDILRWVRFGEFLTQPMVCLIDRQPRDQAVFDAEVAEWRRCCDKYIANQAIEPGGAHRT